MASKRKELKRQKAAYEEKIKALRPYVQELTQMCEKHGTDRSHYEADLMEAENNISFYESRINDIRAELKSIKQSDDKAAS